MRDHFGVVVGVSFGGGTGGGVWLLVSTASAALCIHYSVYVLEASTPWRRRIGTRASTRRAQPCQPQQAHPPLVLSFHQRLSQPLFWMPPSDNLTQQISNIHSFTNHTDRGELISQGCEDGSRVLCPLVWRRGYSMSNTK